MLRQLTEFRRQPYSDGVSQMLESSALMRGLRQIAVIAILAGGSTLGLSAADNDSLSEPLSTENATYSEAVGPKPEVDRMNIGIRGQVRTQK